MQECAGTSVLQEFRVCVPAAQELQFPAAKEPAQEDAAKLNGMTLGPELVTRVFIGSVLLQSIPDLACQASRWGSTG